MNLDNLKYIAVAQGKVWGMVKEHRGYIFRRIDNPYYGFSGHYATEQDCIQATLDYKVMVINVESELVVSSAPGASVHLGDSTLTR